MRRPRRMVGLVVVVALVAVGCASGEGGASSDGGEVAAQELDCERFDYPCSWDEVGAEAAERTDQLLAFSSLLLADGAPAEELAGRLEAAAGVAEVAHDPIGVWFRVEGAVPVSVYVDPTEGGQLEGAVPPVEPRSVTLAQAPEGTFSGCAAAGEDRADGERGPVGEAGEPKKALILGPWAWQMDWEPTVLAARLKGFESDYSKENGGVTVKVTSQDLPSAFGGDPAVRLEDFCGWEAYDTIMLKTHGRTICPDAGRCHTGLSVGRFAEDEDTLREYAGGATGVSFATSRYGNLKGDLTKSEREDCIVRLEEPPEGEDDPAAEACLEKVPEAGHLEITTDFFRANYPDGLPDKFIFFSACQGMKEGDLGRALHPDDSGPGAVLGFDRIITTPIANKVMDKFAKLVRDGHAANQEFLDKLNKIVDDAGGQADVTGQIEGDVIIEGIADVADEGDSATRGADVVSLHTEQGGPELTDNGRVQVDGHPGDDEDGKLELELGMRLTGVGEEGPDAYEIEIRLDDRALDLEDYSWDDTDEEGIFDAEVVAVVGVDLDPDERFDLEIRTVLPDAGEAVSRWEYEDLGAGTTMTCLELAAAAMGIWGRLFVPPDRQGPPETLSNFVDRDDARQFAADLRRYGRTAPEAVIEEFRTLEDLLAPAALEFADGGDPTIDGEAALAAQERIADWLDATCFR